MRFAHPEYLYALGLVPALLVFYIVMFRNKTRALARLGNPALLAKLSRGVSPGRQRWKVALILASVTCGIVALARPQFGTHVETVKREGLEIMVVLDVSNSMLAEDIRPNRLERAKHAVRSLIARLQGDRIGLVVFAGAAFLQCPMTSDYGAVEMFLSGLDTETVGTQGTAIGQALHAAMRAFGEKQREHKVVVLLTDGEDHDDDPVAAARDLANTGIRVYVIGVGSPFGEPIPVKDAQGNVTGHRRDGSGAIVMSRLDEVILQQVAAETGGGYYPSTLEEAEVDIILEDIARLGTTEFDARQFTRYEERYQYVLAFGFLLLCIEAFISDRKTPRAEWQGRFE